MKDAAFLIILVALQALCALFFVSDIVLTVFGMRATPISWQSHEFLEIGASVGLILGMVLGWLAFRRTLRRSRAAEASLRVVRSAFQDHLEDRFTEWALTPAERDVALFSLKGFAVREIAEMRQTSEGTVRAQSNAIYRKAEVSGRAQLLSLFIEDLMEDGAQEQAQRDDRCDPTERKSA